MSSQIVSKNPQVIVRKSAWGAVQARHPWLLAGSLEETVQSIADGEVVDLLQADGRWIGRGIYNSKSRIRVRIYSWDRSEELNEHTFLERLDRALNHRLTMAQGVPLEAQRLVFSEADRLSGLIIDRYANYIMLQFTAAALCSYEKAIVERLMSRYQPSGVFLRIDAQTAKTEGIEPREEWVAGEGPSESVEIVDNGLRWKVDLEKGQKTGYYLDQRENRLAAAKWMTPNGRALDVCCYVGGLH